MPGNDQFTKSLLQFDGNLTDTALNVGAGRTWTAVGTVSTAGTPKFGTGALSLSNPNNSGTAYNANNYISTPATGLWLGAGDWTIDFFVDIPSTTNYHYLCGHTSSNFKNDSIYSWTIAVNMISGSGGLQFSVTDGTTGRGVGGLVTPGYKHIEVSRSGGTLRLFIDGTLAQSTTIAITPADVANFVYVGCAGGFIGMTATLDAFRMSIGIARHTANFTPPAAPYAIDYTALGAGVGNYVYAGIAIASFKIARVILAARGAFALTGKIATLLYGKVILIAATGAYTATLWATLGSKNGHPILLLAAETGQYIKSGFTNYLLRAIKKLGLGNPPSLQQTRRKPPTLDV